MKITKRQLRRIIKEETGGDWEGEPAPKKKTYMRPRPRFPGALQDQMMEMLEEYINRLAESGTETAVEVETLITQLVSRAIDIAVRDEIIK